MGRLVKCRGCSKQVNTDKYADLYEVCYRLLESLND